MKVRRALFIAVMWLISANVRNFIDFYKIVGRGAGFLRIFAKWTGRTGRTGRTGLTTIV